MAGGISYPQSWTDIANQALGRLGTKLIANLTEPNSANANYCRLFIGQAVEDVFGEYDWNAATARLQLAQLSDTPAFGFSYAYQLPADFLRPVEILEGTYTIEQDRILTDSEELYLVYIALPGDATKMPPYLRKAIGLRLADILTDPLTSSKELAAQIKVEYQEAIRSAIQKDAKRTQETTVGDELGHTWADELR